VNQLGGIKQATSRAVQGITGGSMASVQRVLVRMRGRQHVPANALRYMRALSASLQRRLETAGAWANAVQHLATEAGLPLPAPPAFLVGEALRDPDALLLVLLEDDQAIP